MNNSNGESVFSWVKAIGFGLVLWLILFIVAVVLVSLNLALSVGTMLVLAFVAAILAFSFSKGLNLANAGQAFGYGFIWLVVGLVLDLVVSRQMNPGIFNQWAYWLGYALILLTPWFEYERQGSGARRQPV